MPESIDGRSKLPESVEGWLWVELNAYAFCGNNCMWYRFKFCMHNIIMTTVLLCSNNIIVVCMNLIIESGKEEDSETMLSLGEELHEKETKTSMYFAQLEGEFSTPRYIAHINVIII